VRVLAFNHVQRHVDSGRDTCRSDDLPFVDNAEIVQGVHRRKLGADICNGSPVRGRAFAIQQPRFREQESAGANAGRQCIAGVLRGNPVDYAGIVDFAAGAVAARNDDDVQWRMIFDGVVGLNQQTTTTGDDVALFRDDRRRVEPGAIFCRCRRKDFEGAAEIKDLDFVENQNAN